MKSGHSTAKADRGDKLARAIDASPMRANRFMRWLVHRGEVATLRQEEIARAFFSAPVGCGTSWIIARLAEFDREQSI